MIDTLVPPTPAPTTTSRLRAEALTLGYGDRTVVADLTLDVPDQAVTVLVVANGSGKSTLLRGLARLLRPASGAVLLDGAAVHRLPTKQVARTVGLLPQSPSVPDGVRVVDLVGLGRQPHLGLLRRWSADDGRAVADAMALTDTLSLA